MAKNLINNDPFYGYNPNLGAVRSTRYKGLGYVGYRLCMDYLGMNTLRQYGGFKGTIKHKTELDTVVDEHITNRKNRSRYRTSNSLAQNQRLNNMGNRYFSSFLKIVRFDVFKSFPQIQWSLFHHIET